MDIRIEEEFAVAIPERTVCHHVHKRRRESARKTEDFVPQSYPLCRSPRHGCDAGEQAAMPYLGKANR